MHIRCKDGIKRNVTHINTLTHVVAENYLDAVQFCLHNIVDVNREDDYGHIALIVAAQRGNAIVTRL